LQSFELEVFDLQCNRIELGLDHGLVADVVLAAHVLQREFRLEAQEVALDASPFPGLGLRGSIERTELRIPVLLRLRSSSLVELTPTIFRSISRRVSSSMSSWRQAAKMALRRAAS
jgi:hypothetical protein